MSAALARSPRRPQPGPHGARSRVRLALGEGFAADELSELDHFLTACWVLTSSAGARHRFARAWHRAWPLRRAHVIDLDDELVAAAGLPHPAGPPLVHWSAGVDVRIGRPELYRRTVGGRASGGIVRKVTRAGVVSVAGCLAWIVTVAVGVAPAVAITNGQPDAGRHPEVGALVGFFAPAGTSIAYCSGTLIAPTVFLTAAHCGFLGTPTVQVTFDEVYTPTSAVHTGTFHAHPDFRPGTNAQGANNPDIAVVVFDAPVSGIVPAQLPTAGLLDQMKASGALDQSSQFTSVGYGDSEFVNGPGGHTTTHLQSRNVAVGAFNSLTSAYLHLTQNSGNGGTCNGDSGGPNFLGAGADETPVIAGLTVTGDTYCGSTNVDYRLDTAAARAFLGDYVTAP